MEGLPTEVFQLISQYLTQQDLSQLSQTSRTTRSQVSRFTTKIKKWIEEMLKVYSIDDLIFGISDGSIPVDDPNHVIQASQVLDTLLKRKKYSNEAYVDTYIKHLIRRGFTPLAILERVLKSHGVIPATKFVSGFKDPEIKKQLNRHLSTLYRRMKQ